MKKLLKSILPKRAIKKLKQLKNGKKKQVVKPEYKGDAVHCPICESNFSVFANFGSPVRKSVLCHKCGSLERHRLLHKYLIDEMKLFQPKDTPIKLLHFAPEQMFYNKFVKERHIIYTPCDLFPEAYDYGEIKATKVDITAIPFKDASFDIIICNHVLEHIPDDHLAMTELHRVLAPNGHGVFQVPIDYSLKNTYEDWSITTPEAREKAFGQHDHVRWYGQDYKDRLKKAGFKVDEVNYSKNFDKQEAYRLGLSNSEKIYHCTK